MSRRVKTISFSLVSEYDVPLLRYAEDPERGNFSQYIKRLIADDIARTGQPAGIMTTAPTVAAPLPASQKEDPDREAMSGFL